MISYPPDSKTASETVYVDSLDNQDTPSPIAAVWMFASAMFLVCVPVFVQAPLVRSFPLAGLGATGIWAWISIILCSRPKTQVWGDLLAGFTWTWLAGSLYWGWLRAEPLWHLPIEAIGLPIAIWGIRGQWGRVGHFFYLGSLLGTVVTDVYFYITNLMPAWRQIMQASPDQVHGIFQGALSQMNTAWGIGWVVTLGSLLLGVGCLSFANKSSEWQAFSGAVFSTILVDGLFWLAALLA